MGPFPVRQQSGHSCRKITNSSLKSLAHIPALSSHTTSKMACLAQENFWSNKADIDDAELRYYGKVDGLAAMAGGGPEVSKKLSSLEKENKEMKKVIDDLRKMVVDLQTRVNSL